MNSVVKGETTVMEAQEPSLLDRVLMEDVWISTAKMLAKRSKCKRRQVGCVVTDRVMRRVLGNGYNGRAAGMDDECPGTDPCCLHAEVNALIASGGLEKQKVMFVTVAPCIKCSMMIVNSNFRKVIYLETGPSSEGLNLLERAGVEVIRYRKRTGREEKYDALPAMLGEGLEESA